MSRSKGSFHVRRRASATREARPASTTRVARRAKPDAANGAGGDCGAGVNVPPRAGAGAARPRSVAPREARLAGIPHALHAPRADDHERPALVVAEGVVVVPDDLARAGDLEDPAVRRVRAPRVPVGAALRGAARRGV